MKSSETTQIPEPFSPVLTTAKVRHSKGRPMRPEPFPDHLYRELGPVRHLLLVAPVVMLELTGVLLERGESVRPARRVEALVQHAEVAALQPRAHLKISEENQSL